MKYIPEEAAGARTGDAVNRRKSSGWRSVQHSSMPSVPYSF